VNGVRTRQDATEIRRYSYKTGQEWPSLERKISHKTRESQPRNVTWRSIFSLLPELFPFASINQRSLHICHKHNE